MSELTTSQMQLLLRAAEEDRAKGVVPGSGGAKAGGGGAKTGFDADTLRLAAGGKKPVAKTTNALSPNPTRKPTQNPTAEFTPKSDEAQYQGAVNAENAVHQMVIGGEPQNFQILDRAGDPVRKFDAKLNGSWVYLLNQEGYPEYSAKVAVSDDGKKVNIYGLDAEGNIGRGAERAAHLVSGGRGILASGARFFGADDAAESLEVGVGDVEREEGLVRLRAQMGFADAPHVQDLQTIEGLGSGGPFIAGQAGLARVLRHAAGMSTPAAAATSSAAMTVPVVGGEGGETLKQQTGEETGIGTKAGMGGLAAAGTSLTEGLMAMVKRRGGRAGFLRGGRGESVQEAGDEAIELAAQQAFGVEANEEDYIHAAKMGFLAGGVIGGGADITGKVGGQIQARKMLDEAATAKGLKGKEKDEVVRLALAAPKDRVADIVDGMTDKEVDELMFLEGAADKRQALAEAVELIREEAVVAGAAELAESEEEDSKAQDALAKKRWGSGWRKKTGLEEKEDRELEEWQDAAEDEFYRGVAELKGIVGTGDDEQDTGRIKSLISALSKGEGNVEAKVEELIPTGVENSNQKRKAALDILGKMAKNLDESAVAATESKRRKMTAEGRQKFDEAVGRQSESDYKPITDYRPIAEMNDEELEEEEKKILQEKWSASRHGREIPAEEDSKMRRRVVEIWDEREKRKAAKKPDEKTKSDEQTPPPPPPAPPAEEKKKETPPPQPAPAPPPTQGNEDLPVEEYNQRGQMGERGWQVVDVNPEEMVKAAVMRQTQPKNKGKTSPETDPNGRGVVGMMKVFMDAEDGAYFEDEQTGRSYEIYVAKGSPGNPGKKTIRAYTLEGDKPTNDIVGSVRGGGVADDANLYRVLNEMAQSSLAGNLQKVKVLGEEGERAEREKVEVSPDRAEPGVWSHQQEQQDDDKKGEKKEEVAPPPPPAEEKKEPPTGEKLTGKEKLAELKRKRAQQKGEGKKDLPPAPTPKVSPQQGKPVVSDAPPVPKDRTKKEEGLSNDALDNAAKKAAEETKKDEEEAKIVEKGSGSKTWKKQVRGDVVDGVEFSLPQEKLSPDKVHFHNSGRSQFRIGADETGKVKNTLGDKVAPDRTKIMTNPLYVYRDEQGKNWIYDGHHRLVWYRDTLKLKEFPAVVMDWQDGWTHNKARVYAAMNNLQSATEDDPLIAWAGAKLLKDLEGDPEGDEVFELRKEQIGLDEDRNVRYGADGSRSNPVIIKSANLAKLGKTAFNFAITPKVRNRLNWKDADKHIAYLKNLNDEQQIFVLRHWINGYPPKDFKEVEYIMEQARVRAGQKVQTGLLGELDAVAPVAEHAEIRKSLFKSVSEKSQLLKKVKANRGKLDTRELKGGKKLVKGIANEEDIVKDIKYYDGLKDFIERFGSGTRNAFGKYAWATATKMQADGTKKPDAEMSVQLMETAEKHYAEHLAGKFKPQEDEQTEEKPSEEEKGEDPDAGLGDGNAFAPTPKKKNAGKKKSEAKEKKDSDAEPDPLSSPTYSYKHSAEFLEKVGEGTTAGELAAKLWGNVYGGGKKPGDQAILNRTRDLARSQFYRVEMAQEYGVLPTDKITPTEKSRNLVEKLKVEEESKKGKFDQRDPVLPLEILKRAREMVRGRWTSKFAEDADGNEIDSDSPKVVKLSVRAALELAHDELVGEVENPVRYSKDWDAEQPAWVYADDYLHRGEDAFLGAIELDGDEEEMMSRLDEGIKRAEARIKDFGTARGYDLLESIQNAERMLEEAAPGLKILISKHEDRDRDNPGRFGSVHIIKEGDKILLTQHHYQQDFYIKLGHRKGKPSHWEWTKDKSKAYDFVKELRKPPVPYDSELGYEKRFGKSNPAPTEKKPEAKPTTVPKKGKRKESDAPALDIGDGLVEKSPRGWNGQTLTMMLGVNEINYVGQKLRADLSEDTALSQTRYMLNATRSVFGTVEVSEEAEVVPFEDAAFTKKYRAMEIAALNHDEKEDSYEIHLDKYIAWQQWVAGEIAEEAKGLVVRDDEGNDKEISHITLDKGKDGKQAAVMDTIHFADGTSVAYKDAKFPNYSMRGWKPKPTEKKTASGKKGETLQFKSGLPAKEKPTATEIDTPQTGKIKRHDKVQLRDGRVGIYQYTRSNGLAVIEMPDGTILGESDKFGELKIPETSLVYRGADKDTRDFADLPEMGKANDVEGFLQKQLINGKTEYIGGERVLVFSNISREERNMLDFLIGKINKPDENEISYRRDNNENLEGLMTEKGYQDAYIWVSSVYGLSDEAMNQRFMGEIKKSRSQNNAQETPEQRVARRQAEGERRRTELDKASMGIPPDATTSGGDGQEGGGAGRFLQIGVAAVRKAGIESAGLKSLRPRVDALAKQIPTLDGNELLDALNKFGELVANGTEQMSDAERYEYLKGFYAASQMAQGEDESADEGKDSEETLPISDFKEVLKMERRAIRGMIENGLVKDRHDGRKMITLASAKSAQLSRETKKGKGYVFQNRTPDLVKKGMDFYGWSEDKTREANMQVLRMAGLVGYLKALKTYDPKVKGHGGKTATFASWAQSKVVGEVKHAIASLKPKTGIQYEKGKKSKWLDLKTYEQGLGVMLDDKFYPTNASGKVVIVNGERFPVKTQYVQRKAETSIESRLEMAGEVKSDEEAQRIATEESLSNMESEVSNLLGLATPEEVAEHLGEVDFEEEEKRKEAEERGEEYQEDDAPVDDEEDEKQKLGENEDTGEKDQDEVLEKIAEERASGATQTIEQRKAQIRDIADSVLTQIIDTGHPTSDFR